MKNYVIFYLCVQFLLIISCEPQEVLVGGCIDRDALNYSYNADVDDGSCQYSNVVFYARYGYYTGIPITQIDVTVNGDYKGSLAATYPTAPSNCYAPGTVQYEIQDGEDVNWNVIITLANGASFTTGGTTRPSAFNECIKVNVTK